MKARGWAVAAALSWPSAAVAQQATADCDSCETCTTALALAGAVVELRGDIDASHATTCVRVTGHGATFDGRRHTVRGAAVAVEVAGEDIVVRNVQVQEGATGFRVVGARSVTLLNAVVNDARVGVRIEGSTNVRVVRASLARDRVGVSMGADDAGRCAGPTPLASPGVVIVRSRIDGGSVGVAACDAMPVLLANAVVNNEQGVLLGDVAAAGAGARGGPWDECSCAAPPQGTPPGTLILYSSGCGGCTVHESWLPQERARGALVRARVGGGNGGPEQERFDAHARHCGAAMIDALGIPGCVPNYECPASGEVWKRRTGDRQLATDRTVGSPDEVVAFSEACRAAGHLGYARGARCVAAAVRSNTLCGNRRGDLAVLGNAARWGLADNRCVTVEGGAACALPCDGVDLTAPVAPTPAPAPPSPREPPPTVAPVVAPPAVVAPVARRSSPMPAKSAKLALAGALAAALAFTVWRSWAKRPPTT